VTSAVQRSALADYPRLIPITTRWNDNDSYGHVNNVVYFEFFDTAINQNLVDGGLLDVRRSPEVALVVDNRCTYFSSISFPDRVRAGIRVKKIGGSSVVYEVGIFRNADDLAAAVGTFVHVYVDRDSSRPVSVPPAVRAALTPLMQS